MNEASVPIVPTILSHTTVLTVKVQSEDVSNPVQRTVVRFVIFGHTPQLEELIM